MQLRSRVDDLLDWVRFQIDRQRVYQPLPDLGVHQASRSHGMESRLARIDELVQELRPATALDVGCNAGFFSLALAQRGLSVVGVDSDPRFLRLFQRAVDAAKLPVGVLQLRVDPDSCDMLPSADMTVYLAVWHHTVRDLGLEGATDILRALWDRTGSVLVFESGEVEMAAHFGLPDMGPSPRDYFEAYLQESCHGAAVRHLGTHTAAPYGDPVERSMFAVIRP